MENSTWSLPSVLQASSFRTVLSIVVCLTPQICLMPCWCRRAAGFSLEALHNGHAADYCCHRLTSISVSQQLETNTQNNKADLDMRFKTLWFFLSDSCFLSFWGLFFKPLSRLAVADGGWVPGQDPQIVQLFPLCITGKLQKWILVTGKGIV